jgi:hypothetical protein
VKAERRVCWRAEEGHCVGRPDQAAARRMAEWLVEWRGDGASGRLVGLSYTAVTQLQSIQTEMEDQAGQQP